MYLTVFRLFSKEPMKISLESKDIKTYNEQVQIMRENAEKIRNSQRQLINYFYFISCYFLFFTSIFYLTNYYYLHMVGDVLTQR